MEFGCAGTCSIQPEQRWQVARKSMLDASSIRERVLVEENDHKLYTWKSDESDEDQTSHQSPRAFQMRVVHNQPSLRQQPYNSQCEHAPCRPGQTERAPQPCVVQHVIVTE